MPIFMYFSGFLATKKNKSRDDQDDPLPFLANDHLKALTI